MTPFWITTSWDDGHILDQRLAELLNRYGLTGTFYISRDYIDSRLTEPQIVDLSKQHEIGAHTINHLSLSQVDSTTAKNEIDQSQQWLQDVLSRNVPAFCYPRGDYNSSVRQMVEQSGFEMARTVEGYQMTGTDRFALPTTIQVYPFPLRPVRSIRARFERLQQAIPEMSRLGLSPINLRSWSALSIALLAHGESVGGFWHLWGHSWEVERYGMWDQLETVFKVAGRYISEGRAQSMTNSQLARAMFGA